VLHGTAEDALAYHLEAEGGGRLPVTLRAVAAKSGTVWMVGDQATVLRWDGRTLFRVDSRMAGTRAPLTAVVPLDGDDGWVAGPTGIWKLVRAPEVPPRAAPDLPVAGKP
jgi:hypothetical protein